MDINLNKLSTENEEQYIWRLGQLYDNGLIDLSWNEIADIINKECRTDGVEYTEATYRKAYQNARKYFDAGVFSDLNEDAYLQELDRKKYELEKERIKLSTEKLELSKWKREIARHELFDEKILSAINNLPSVQIPNRINDIPNTNKKEYILLISDEHYGADFEIKGLHGEIINAYNIDIFEKRMEELYNQVLEIICKEEITTLHIFSLGDCSDGVLRVSQLVKLKYGVVDGSIKYAEFIANWLDSLSQYVKIKYQMTDGNHTELRLLGQPKGSFPNENMGKVISSYIKARLSNNPNFEFEENPTGCVFSKIAGFNILGVHGEVKDLKAAVKDFTDLYNTKIDYLVCGHVHHSKSEELGFNREAITAPSIMGTDPYAFKLKHSSNAGAKLLVLKEGYGRMCEYLLNLQ